jgi:hypothetical protein
MDRACMHGENRNAYRFLVGKQYEGGHLEGLDIDWTILKWTSAK